MQRILLIDDESEWFDRVRTILAPLRCSETGEGVGLTWVSTEEEAAQSIGEGGWSIIICDLRLKAPRGAPSVMLEIEAGIRLVQRAAEHRTRTGADYRIFVLTQFSTDPDLDHRARTAGADEFISKLDRRQLSRKLGQWLDLIEASAPLSEAAEEEPEEGSEHPMEFRALWQLWRSRITRWVLLPSRS